MTLKYFQSPKDCKVRIMPLDKIPWGGWSFFTYGCGQLIQSHRFHSDVLESAFISSWKQIVKFSGILQSSWFQLSDLKSTMVGVFTSWKLANTTNLGIYFIFFCWERVVQRLPAHCCRRNLEHMEGNDFHLTAKSHLLVLVPEKESETPFVVIYQKEPAKNMKWCLSWGGE